MQLTKGAIGNLINRYKAVLKKCHLMNTFGSLAVAGMLVMGGAGMAVAGAAGGTTEPAGKSQIVINKDSENKALTGTYEGYEHEKGGVISVSNGATGVTITNSSFTGNKASAFGGAIFNDGQISITGTTFNNNIADSVGGALSSTTTQTASTNISNSVFTNNHSVYDGGAIGNYSGLKLENCLFEGNTAQLAFDAQKGWTTPVTDNTAVGGGAISLGAVSTSSVASISGTTFKNNTSGTNGGAIATRQAIHANNSAAKLDIAATFIGNKAQQGGAIYNSFYTDNGLGKGAGVTVTGTFSVNEATGKGGAIYNDGTLDKAGRKGGIMTITDATFDGNKADFGGAIFNTGTLTINGGSFEGNTATKAAGAIYNAADAKLTVDGVTFASNSSAIAGAINNSDGTVTIKNSTFKGNDAGKSMGGAVRNNSGSAPEKSIITITGSTFEGNKAGNGGAVWNGSDGEVTITDSTFKGNTALVGDAQQGGAITNADQMTITGSTFEGNQAGKLGGAIFNAASGKLDFKGTNTFTGNTAAEGKDIYNEGTLTMTGDSHLIVDGNQNIYNASSATLTVNSGAKLTITDAVAGGEYEVVTGEGKLDIKTGAWSGDNLQASSDMVALSSNSDGTFTAEGRDAHTVFPNLSEGMTNAVNDLYAPHKGADGKPWNYADVNSDQMGVRFLSRATDNTYLGADKNAAAATIESAARIAFAGAVPQMTKMASDAGSNAVVNRLGFANPADGAQAMDAEGKIVDRNTTGFALWIAPLWQSQHGWGMEADNLDYGFNGNLGGVSLGADYTFENAIRAGITFNIGGGYAESSGGDLNSTENRMSFWGLGAYAGWNYENFGLMADVSYTSTWNDLKQEMDGRMGMGDLEADVQASAISAGLRAEYKLETSVLDVIPHIGVRYMSLNTWGYDVDADGGTVLEGDGFHQDIWTFPVGVTFTKDFTLDSGWSFKPSIDFSVIPAAGDIKAKQDVAFTGLPGSYEVETQMMDYLTWQGGVGLEMGNDTMSFGVNYTLQAGQHTTGHGVFGSFRYEF